MMAVEIPKNVEEQLDLLAPYNNNTHLTHQHLHTSLLDIIDKINLPIVSSFCRTKNLGRLRQKINNSTWEDPVADIHAARLVLRKTDFPKITQAIFEMWPSPESYQFSWGKLPSFRDYSIPGVRSSMNKASDHTYSATHLTIAVPFGARLAEIQLYTVNDLHFYVKTREAYLDRQKGIT